MAKFHIILGNGRGCGVGSSHATEQAAQDRAALLDKNGHGPCRVWKEKEEVSGSVYAEVNGVTVDLASPEYAAWYRAHYG